MLVIGEVGANGANVLVLAEEEHAADTDFVIHLHQNMALNTAR